ncbi:MAG: 4-phosphoerythronate dehydrogenase [Tatlockia sp.]|nr:4-phosphoerythronate dehydrogenase [Tatlockia sp.]
MKILADASLPGLLEAFPKPFELNLYNDINELAAKLAGQQILLCRANLKVNEDLLKNVQTLLYVATASSGSDHIDKFYLALNKIEWIDAKGSNAIAVADYVIATLAFLQKYKGFSGSRAGVIGVGEVGSRVVSRLKAAGMSVILNDPLKAEVDNNFISSSLKEISECDLISVHVNLHDNLPYPSKDLLNEKFLKQLKPGTVLINSSRGGIVNEEALLKESKSLIYCADVFKNEPSINKKIVDMATLCTPHIAGHSIEAKYRAVAMISEKLHAFLNLKPPVAKFPIIAKGIPLPRAANWQDLVLALYNPGNETALLKTSHNIGLRFQTLRKAHHNRHDFCSYPIQSSNGDLYQLLGSK